MSLLMSGKVALLCQFFAASLAGEHHHGLSKDRMPMMILSLYILFGRGRKGRHPSSDWFFFLVSDWIIGRKWRLLIGSISSDMIGWYYKTFQSTFVSNKFIFGPLRSRMRAPHPSRGSPTGDV